jgi:cytochrome c peroxidase
MKATEQFVLCLALSILTAACAYRYEGLDRGQTYATDHFAEARQMRSPEDNPTTPEKVELGDALFHETRLSVDNSRSCASCHQEERGYADGTARSPGRSGRPLSRHTPSLLNVGHAAKLFADGRVSSLEAQSLIPITHPEEMGRQPGTAVDGIRKDGRYRQLFADAFPDNPVVSEANAARALASYQRTLVTGTTPFDLWVRGGRDAISPAAQRGFAVFVGPGNCASCHTGASFTDDRFHDVGLPDGDIGRGAITGRRSHNHQFRTPTLREIGRTAPYMHDGSLPTLDAVVRHYSDSLVERGQRTRRVRLSAEQQRDLVAFLETLDSNPVPAQVARLEP